MAEDDGWKHDQSGNGDCHSDCPCVTEGTYRARKWDNISGANVYFPIQDLHVGAGLGEEGQVAGRRENLLKLARIILEAFGEKEG